MEEKRSIKLHKVLRIFSLHTDMKLSSIKIKLGILRKKKVKKKFLSLHPFLPK